MLKRSSAMLALLLSGCGVWQAASDKTAAVYDTVFHNLGKTVNVDLTAGENLNQDDAGRSTAVAVRVYQLKERKRFDAASFGELANQDTTVLGPDLLASTAAVVNPGGSASLSQPMIKGTEYVATAVFYQNVDKAGTWKQVVVANKLPFDAPLKLVLGDKS